MVKPSLCSPVLCTSIVLFGSGRGISVSENSAAGTSPSVFPPRSTTTPCSVYATTLTSITSLDAAGSLLGGAAGSAALSTVAFVSGFAPVGAGSDSGAGAAAAALDRLSWSENMVVGLRKMTSFGQPQCGPVQSNKFLAGSLQGFSARRFTAERLLGTQMLRASKTLQPCKDTRRVAPVSMNQQVRPYAWPACDFSRRKSGAETSTVRHIS